MTQIFREIDQGDAKARTFDLGHRLFAACILGLGLLGVFSGDFASVWQRIPIENLPAKTAIAYITAAVEIAIGIGLLARQSVAMAARALVVFLLLWAVLLKLPGVVVAPWMEATWLGLSEITILLAGAWIISLNFSGTDENRPFRFVAGATGVRNARILFALSLLPCGLAHFFYVDQTAALVPAWLPWHVGLAYLTGACDIGASIAILTGFSARLAAALVTAMLMIITLLVWTPGLTPASNGLQFQITGFLISAAIATAAWNVANSYRRTPWREPGVHAAIAR
jgi:uncharacterized membrane protein